MSNTENSGEHLKGIPGVQPDYATKLAALGVKMTPEGKVKSLGSLLGEVVDAGGANVTLEDALDWAKRAEIADAELSALVVDSAQMIADLTTLQTLEPGSAAVTYALEGIRHLQTHMEKMVFGFMYGVEQGDEAKRAIFGPTGRSSG